MLYPEKNRSELLQQLALLQEDQLAIVCYCAAWCKTCTGFETQLEQLEQKYPQHLFVWVDIEEHENLLVDEDIEDFPTILIQNKKGTVFYGPLLPFAEHIDRLLQQASKKMVFTHPITNFEQLVIATTQ